MHALELVRYQTKCQLIKEWDDLFNKLRDNTNALKDMKLSPYYKVFDDEASQWEDKLNRLSEIFDVWVDVQRRWVYLDGIFAGSADIGQLLPNESQRFASISHEFTGLMRKVAKSPMILDVLNIAGLNRSLSRLADLLQKIQKALGEYLERERSQFPRFYFVGDEDLLEIIGNSKSIPRLQKHFKKMFAGVHSLILEDADKIISGIASKEGEIVNFDSDLIVSTEKHSKINDWLTKVEQSMKTALAKKFHVSFMKFKDLELTDAGAIETWLDGTEAQLVPLCAQLLWSQRVENNFSQSVEEIVGTEKSIEASLKTLANAVLGEQPALRRRKLEELIKEFVHLREVTRNLVKDPNVAAAIADGGKVLPYSWLTNLRLKYDDSKSNVEEKLSLHIANTSFLYGYEYLGVQEGLVKIPLTDRCYLTMTQALQYKLGGSPFGPAGTGKTETVKALG